MRSRCGRVQVAGKGGIILAAGAAWLLNRIFAPKPPKPPIDTTSPTLSDRGSYIPLVIGRRRVGPVIGWVGDRRAETKETGGGGKGGGGGGGAKYNVYFEKAWHLLCVGPISKIHAIYRSGELESNNGGEGWSAEDIEAGVFQAYGEHGFYPYWGACDQEVNTRLGDASRVGVSSAWPGIGYIEWSERSLGQAATWPQVEYDLEVRIGGAGLAGDAWLDAKTKGSAIDVGEEGVNPAHALYYLITAPHPFGCGVSPSRLDNDWFEDLGTLCATEHLPVNILAPNGKDALQLIGELLSDVGVALPQVEGLLVPKPQRAATGTVPTVPKSLYQHEQPDIVIANERTAMTRSIYSYANVSRGFAVQDVPIGDDGLESQRGQRKERTAPLQTVTHWNVARRIIDRREQEMLAGSQKVELIASREAKLLSSGQIATFTGLGQLRILRMIKQQSSADWRIECMPDIYAIGTDQTQPDEPGYPTDPADEPAEADKFFFVELPRELGDGSRLGLYVLRIPGNQFIAGALQHVSDDGSTYQSVGEGSGHAFGGILAEDVPQDPSDITTGPVFYSEGGDPDIIEDLSAATSRWETGEQWLVSEFGEIMYVQSITAIGGGFYRADGLKRRRLGTTEQRHPWGTRIALIPARRIVENTSTLLDVGDDISLKSQPYTNLDVFDLASVVPFTREWQGRSRAPLPPSNVSANGGTNEYTAAGSVTMDFTLTDTAEDGSTIAIDTAIMEIYDHGGTLLRTITEASPVVGANAITYTNGQIVTDWGSDPDYMDVHCLCTSGANRSHWVCLTVYLSTADQGTDGVAILRHQVLGDGSVEGADPGAIESYSMSQQELL